jgi:hypothetical protein
MKIRNGFVSNSSTASFLVKNEDRHHTDHDLLTAEEVNLLLGQGFTRTWAFYPDQLNNSTEIDTTGPNFGYFVTCNEDEILEWLIKNNIAFTANCHYDQFTVVYNKNSDYLISLRNNGMYYLMYGYNTTEDILLKMMSEPAVKLIDKNKFLRGEEGYFI